MDTHRPTHFFEINNLVIQARIPPGEGPFPVFTILHGWTGDENSMWIFASRLPVNAIVLSPRGLYESPMGGYSWYQKRDKAWPVLNDFDSAIDALTDVLTTDFFPKGDFSQFRMLGFSLGAALVYSFALKKAKPLRALAGLSGFVPDGAAELEEARPLQDLAVFIAHGTRDQLVPIERARQGVEVLQQTGAIISYCEHEAGHKLNAGCFRSLQLFFQTN